MYVHEQNFDSIKKEIINFFVNILSLPVPVGIRGTLLPIIYYDPISELAMAMSPMPMETSTRASLLAENSMGMEK
jgi:hypothetical protein